MSAVEFSAATAANHAPLVQRVDGIFAAMGMITGGPGPDIVLADRTEPGRASVRLTRGPRPALRRAESGLELDYLDGSNETTLAALLAAATPAGLPIAADTESLTVLALAERLAASDIPVLINGPTGTGKEVLSRFIHARSPRRDGPFIAVNCAAMPEAMLEALLFGHQKGAFTGASQSSEGFFRAADGGTLLLDEIAEMPLTLQAKLLRALQEGEVVPIGATSPIKVDVRIIACANRDLPLEVQEGRFRADLFYRLNVFPLALLPLRERGEDIAPLAFALLLRHAAPGQPIPWLSESALALLKAHSWPGNVRELENVMRRALLLAGNADEIAPHHIHFDGIARLVEAGATAQPGAPAGGFGGLPGGGLPGGGLPTAVPGAGGKTLSNIVQMHEARAIMQALAECGGSRVAAARRLGISERTLRYRLASFREAGLEVAAAGGRS
ncbi:sigma 54-interacting transcriptional regulator [Novosphingobium flavum]|uniref:Sigma 54-interacting transcriptional regulator n=1 Tax=Novosphingobium aerophilum TaxID=2839843 RepID=A0A7X1F8V6_9SPHN|nr:sigma 54-interacting transcriptional regulator [Novosphingobium aerophilum]MBC2652139.1 sigma 54-interacting transcriptional regulator [Novosphingobium aerophilum]MBC2661096.1 sigma 54-interacting transcriptional regulator [Novosphingobium aerophilum]